MERNVTMPFSDTRRVDARRTAGSRMRGVLRIIVPTLAAVVLVVLTGCRVEMYDQPRMKSLRGSQLFADSMSARPQVQGTVPRNPVWSNHTSSFSEATGGTVNGTGIAAERDSADRYGDALALNGTPADKNGSIPFPVTTELVKRGQDRFNIYCSPCHGRMGDGNGMIVQRGFPQPQTYHSDRLRAMPDGYFYDVITNGFGRMYSYASRVVPEDRWAIVAYIRALQLSQHATLNDIPAQERNKIEGSAQ